MPRKTDSNNPSDWILMCESDLEVLRMAVKQELGYSLCRSKLAEVLGRGLKAELIRTGWPLAKTHDLERLYEVMTVRGSDLAGQADPLCKGLAEAYFTDRYPGFDLEDPDWPKLREQLRQIEGILQIVKSRLPSQAS